MKNIIDNMAEALDYTISGFHQYSLEGPARLSFVSRNLCEMTGFEKDELLSESEDGYERLLHPGDLTEYRSALEKLSREECKLTLRYRVVKKNGDILCVSDELISRRSQDGVMRAYSVLSDITELKAENDNLHFLNETIPCGFLKYTCEKTPKITYINKEMLKILRFPEIKEGELDYLELYKENVYLMIPIEERKRFAVYLDRVYKKSAPIAGEIPVLRCDGTRAHLFGWVTKCVNDKGEEEFQSACMDITERYHVKKESETKKYITALTEVYDKIFEYNRQAGTVKCLYGEKSAMFRHLQNIPMQMEEATEKWIEDTVAAEDRERVSKFFKDFYLRKFSETDSRLPQIKYRAKSSDGTVKTYMGLFLKLDADVSLFCCRNMLEEDEAVSLRSENETLKNMQDLVMRFTEGVVAFEVKNGTVKPLYTSDNVCNFFGYTKEEWLSLTEKNHSIKDFIHHSGIDYEDVEKLFETGEAEFTYLDVAQNTYRRIKAICSDKYSDGNSPCYVMLYNVGGAGDTGGLQGGGVYIRTFGYFDVFVNDKPIAFRSQKSKELFALLTDRRGGYVSSEEAISFLWEDEPVNAVTLSRYRKVALRLKNILEEYGVSDIVESVDGKRRIVPERVRCDLYDYLSGKEEYSQLFKGSYLTNYSWGETTLGELSGGQY